MPPRAKFKTAFDPLPDPVEFPAEEGESTVFTIRVPKGALEYFDYMLALDAIQSARLQQRIYEKGTGHTVKISQVARAEWARELLLEMAKRRVETISRLLSLPEEIETKK